MSESRLSTLTRIEAWVREAPEMDHKWAHGWNHTVRVRRSIRILARAEGVDPFLAELAALLHDVGRTRPGPEQDQGARSAAVAGPLLDSLPLRHSERQATLHTIRWHSSGQDGTSLLCVLRNADMLDGLGAVGIIRAFTSKSHLPPYDPDAPLRGGRSQWPPKYSRDQHMGLMAWYGRLSTQKARQMAKHRIHLTAAFVAQARRELLQPDD